MKNLVRHSLALQKLEMTEQWAAKVFALSAVFWKTQFIELQESITNIELKQLSRSRIFAWQYYTPVSWYNIIQFWYSIIHQYFVWYTYMYFSISMHTVHKSGKDTGETTEVFPPFDVYHILLYCCIVITTIVVTLRDDLYLGGALIPDGHGKESLGKRNWARICQKDIFSSFPRWVCF